jgi:ABC-type phosphate transport system substrate-binding protein
MKKFCRILALIMLAAPVLLWAADDDLVVVVNKANPTSDLTKSQLRKLVLGEQSSWPSGGKVLVVLQSPGSAERGGVLRWVCRMSEDDYNQHLMHASFNGESSAAPKIVTSGAAARQMVASNPGALSFLRVADVNASVKVVSVEGANAGDPEYKFKAVK